MPPPSAADLEIYHVYMRFLQANDWPSLCRYRDENRALAGEERPPVVLLGDSITENWSARDPALFEAGIINRGIGGQTTQQMLLRFYQDVIALHPHVVHIMAGTNDIAGNNGVTSDTSFQNTVRALVALARTNHIAVILASIPPAAAYPAKPDLHPAGRIRAWSHWLRDYARSERIVFVDYHAVLTDPVGAMLPGLAHDGVHPTHAGYLRMAPLFHDALVQAERR